MSRDGLLSPPPCAESPFAHPRCYLSWRDVWRHVGRHYPPLHRSYGLMGQTKTLPPPSALAWSAGLCRLPQAPAGRWPFPALSPQSLYRCLDPYPAVSLWCLYSFLPKGLRPHLTAYRFGTHENSSQCNFYEGMVSRLQSFRYVQAPILTRPPGCTHR